jgi:DNA-binding NarL/FixJ family response regulator
MKVLLIGDSDLEHDIFELALSRININAELFGVTSCEDALSQLANQSLPSLDYVILDTDIPFANANACLKMLKGSPVFKFSKIIVYSSSEEQADIQFMLKHGARSHLFKSRSFAVFCRDLRHQLSAV